MTPNQLPAPPCSFSKGVSFIFLLVAFCMYMCGVAFNATPTPSLPFFMGLDSQVLIFVGMRPLEYTASIPLVVFSFSILMNARPHFNKNQELSSTHHFEVG